MDAWWETAQISLLIFLGVLGSLRLAKCPKAYWVTGYCLALMIILTFVLTRKIEGLEFVPPFSWLSAGRTRFALAAIVIPVLLTPLVFQIRKRRLQYLLGTFGILALFQYSLMPFLHPAVTQGKLLSLRRGRFLFGHAPPAREPCLICSPTLCNPIMEAKA